MKCSCLYLKERPSGLQNLWDACWNSKVPRKGHRLVQPCRSSHTAQVWTQSWMSRKQTPLQTGLKQEISQVLTAMLWRSRTAPHWQQAKVSAPCPELALASPAIPWQQMMAEEQCAAPRRVHLELNRIPVPDAEFQKGTPYLAFQHI